MTPPPPRPDLVPRPRLIERLRQTSEPVLLIHAPAGYGKTTLVAQFAEDDFREVAWLTTGPNDRDAWSLVAGLADAFGEGMDEVRAALTAGADVVLPIAVPRLVGALQDRDRPVLLVVDEAHLIDTAEAIDVLRALGENLPAGSQLVLAGRSRPALPIARWRTDRRLAEFTADDLRMSAEEGREMLTASAGATVDPRAADSVLAQAEGWPAAIYLASIPMRDERRPRPGATSVGPRERDLADYFHDEVLPWAHPEDAEFLVRTSVLDVLRPPVCDAVLERTDSATRLRALSDADLFVTPAGPGGAHRVHGLFRSCLQAELHHRDPAEERALHGRASAWYAEAGDIGRAVRHALAAGDADRAADLVWTVTAEYQAQGRSAVLQRWLEWFTPEQRRAHPSLALTAIVTRLDAGDGDGVRHWCTVAMGAAGEPVLSDGTPVRAIAGLMRATVDAGGIRAMATGAAEAEGQLAADHPFRALSSYLCGTAAHLTGDRDAAKPLLSDAETRAAAGLPTMYGMVLAQQALIAIDEGDWMMARSLTTRARTFGRDPATPDYTTQSITVATTALVAAHHGDRDTARVEARRAALLLARQRQMPPWHAAQGRLVLARAHVLLREGVPARTLLAEAREAVALDPGVTVLRACLDALETEVAHLTGTDPDEDSLTTAELRTLQFLPTHLSMREVGERLYVSRNTVKTHTSAIYRKLGVGTRSQAVERARALGLLEE